MEVNRKMSEVLTSILPLILPLGVGGIGGFIVGYAVKKIYKPAIIIGLFTLSIAYLAYANIINLNIGELETISRFISTIAPFIIMYITSSLLFMSGFLVGLISGLKRG